MGTIDISYLSLGIGLLLLLIPLFYIWKFKTGLLRATLIGTARMIVQLFFIGVYLKFLFLWNNPWINFLWVIVMILVASQTALARVYYWEGEYELAYKEAKEVVEATYPYGSKPESCFNFVEYSSLGTNLKDYNSIIMCFFNKTLQEDYIPYITRGNQTLFILDSDNIFADNKEQDRRFLLQTGSYNSNAYSLKYDIKLGQDGSDMVPGIRLSEMYYIMGEYFARKGEYSQAGKMLDEVRYARGILTTNMENSIGSLEGFHTELLKDMRKEFVGEGQMFFQYKRMDKKPVDNAIFVFDKPDNEDV